MSGVIDPVFFDVDHNGTREQTSWTARSGDSAFLAIDRNGNGLIDDGGELFGNGMKMNNGQFAPNGFEALAELDTNHDNIIDSSDAAWPHLLLWIDRNHNGVSEPDEIVPIAQSQITAIDVEYHWTGRVDADGNRFGYEGHLHEGNAVRTFYDVFLKMVPGTNGQP